MKHPSLQVPEMSPNLTENVPPKLQHRAASVNSASFSPSRKDSIRERCLQPLSRTHLFRLNSSVFHHASPFRRFRLDMLAELLLCTTDCLYAKSGKLLLYGPAEPKSC